MAIQTATTLKTYFNTGDVPTESQFSDLIDSSIGYGIDFLNPTSITTTATASFNTYHIASGTTADYTITLPTIAAGDVGKTLVIEISSACTKLITIDGASTNTIDGALTRIMWATEVCHLRATSTTSWTKIGGKSVAMKAGLKQAAAQTFAAGVFTKLNLTAQLFTPSLTGCIDTTNKRIIFLRAGSYEIKTNMITDATNASTTAVYTSLYNNGVQGASYAAYSGIGTGQVSIGGTSAVSKAVNDYVELYGYYASGDFVTSFPWSGDFGATFVYYTEVLSW